MIIFPIYGYGFIIIMKGYEPCDNLHPLMLYMYSLLDEPGSSFCKEDKSEKHLKSFFYVTLLYALII